MNHIQSLRKHIEEGTLIRKRWVGTDAQGRATACLLAAMVPQCGEDESPSPCPAEVMPGWLAELTPWLDDNGSDEAWPAMVERFASLAARWHALDAAAWRRVQYTFLAGAVREAARHTQEQATLTVCERVAILCDGVVSTGVIDAVEFDAARDAAWDAAGAAARDAAGAAARDAARAAARAAAGDAARDAAGAAAGAAARDAAGDAAWDAAWDAAGDRMTTVLFDAIEKELA